MPQIRDEIQELFKRNKTLTRTHILFIAESFGGSKESYYHDLVGEFRSGRFEEISNIPVAVKIIKRKSFFYRSDVPLEETNFEEVRDTWVRKKK